MANFNKELKFEQERHNLELESMKKTQDKNRILIISICLGLILISILIVLWIRYNLIRVREALLKNEKKQLVLEKKLLKENNEKLNIEKQNAELEMNNQLVVSEQLRLKNIILIKERQNLELEKRNAELERDHAAKIKSELELKKRNIELEVENQKLLIENMEKEIYKLEKERKDLNNILKNQEELSKPVKSAIKERIEMLNHILLSEITQNDKASKISTEILENAIADKSKFINTTRLAFKASHPDFINNLEQKGLTEAEINYVCLYAIGMKGKEAGHYINKNGHFNTSSIIRKKLGLKSDSTNLGIYIRKLLNNSPD